MVTRVSVVIPAFNAAAYVADAVRSALRQSFSEIEIIVVDDGSTDDTAAVVESIGGVQCIRKANGGVSSARNLGASHASGDFIAFLDADDFWHRDKILAQVWLMDRYPDSDITYTRIVEDLDAYHSIEKDTSKTHVDLESCYSIVKSLEPSFLNPYFGTSSVMVRRKAFDHVNGFDEELPIAEDIDFFLKIIINRPVIPVVEFAAVFKRPVAGSLGDDSTAGYEMLLRVYERLVIGHPELEAKYPKMVRRAFGDLHFRHAASLLRRPNQRLASIASVARSLMCYPTTSAMTLLLRACIPRLIRGALSSVKKKMLT